MPEGAVSDLRSSCRQATFHWSRRDFQRVSPTNTTRRRSLIPCEGVPISPIRLLSWLSPVSVEPARRQLMPAQSKEDSKNLGVAFYFLPGEYGRANRVLYVGTRK